MECEDADARGFEETIPMLYNIVNGDDSRRWDMGNAKRWVERVSRELSDQSVSQVIKW